MKKQRKRRYGRRTLWRLWQTPQKCFGWRQASTFMDLMAFKVVAGYLPLVDRDK